MPGQGIVLFRFPRDGIWKKKIDYDGWRSVSSSQIEHMKLNMSKSGKTLLVGYSEEIRNENQETFVYANDISIAAMFELARNDFEQYQVKFELVFYLLKQDNF